MKIPSEQLLKIEAKGEGPSKVFNVTRRIPPILSTEASERFAQQILTAIITLVASIAAFYFATQTVGAARGETSSLQPFIIGLTNNKVQTGGPLDSVEIIGKNFLSPVTVRFVGTKDFIFPELSATPTKISLLGKTIPQGQPAGPYDLIVVNADGGEARLDKKFEVI
jgi:hypothetical protein